LSQENYKYQSMKREICMVTPTTTGGHAIYTLDLLSALAAAHPCRELEVSLFTCSDLPARYRTGSYIIHDRLPPMRPVSDFRIPTLWSFYRQWYLYMRERLFVRLITASPHCRAIHFQEYTPWLMRTHFSRLKRAGFRLFYTVHGVYPNRYMDGVPKAVFHKWCRDGWKQCDALFVHTEGLGQSLRHFLGEDHPPVFITPPGVSDSLECREQSAMPVLKHDPRQLLFFGVIRPTKGLHVLLQAMHELPECHLTIAGDFKEASYKKKMLAEIARLPREQVNLIDRFVDDDEVAGIFALGGMLVLPYTFFFAQSGVLHLAMKFGMPVVASDVGGPGESIRDWGVGTCVAPNDPKALAEGIRRMIEPNRYESAKAAAEIVRYTLKWEHTAQLTWQAYHSILESAR
jgi:glycosyltransferase involved in cell wall biosynthesis